MLAVLNGFLWAFLRRWYGGFNPFTGITGNFFRRRIIKSVVMMISIFVVLEPRGPLWLVLLCTLWIQFQFWSRAVGEVLDCGRSKIQNAKSYNRWFRLPLDKIYNHLGKKKYTGFYDWWYTWLRYTLPMIVPAVAFHSMTYIIIGLMSAPVYFLFYKLFDKKPQLLKLPHWIGQPKNMSELAYGFIFGFGIWIG